MKKLLLILLCLPMIGFGQSWEMTYGVGLNVINKGVSLMSLTDRKSQVITRIDTLDDYSFSASDWIYNDKNELWIKLECWDWQDAHCCECPPEKTKEGWVMKEDISAPSIFSESLIPLTKSMIEKIGVVRIINNNYDLEFKDYGWYIKGYGGVLLLKGYVNIKGRLTKLAVVNWTRYPNKDNLYFNPYDIYKSDEIELKIFNNQQSEGIRFIEINYQGLLERILLTEIKYNHEPHL